MKKFSCPVCPQSFAHKAKLEKHCSQVHLKDCPELKCNICVKFFGRKADLDRHNGRVHLSKKDFDCDVCEKKFSHSGHLTRHKSDGEKVNGSVSGGIAQLLPVPAAPGLIR